MSEHDPKPPVQFITFEELQRRMGGRSRPAINRDMREGRIPKAISLGGVRYWLDHEVEAALLKFAEDHRAA